MAVAPTLHGSIDSSPIAAGLAGVAAAHPSVSSSTDQCSRAAWPLSVSSVLGFSDHGCAERRDTPSAAGDQMLEALRDARGPMQVRLLAMELNVLRNAALLDHHRSHLTECRTPLRM